MLYSIDFFKSLFSYLAMVFLSSGNCATSDSKVTSCLSPHKLDRDTFDKQKSKRNRFSKKVCGPCSTLAFLQLEVHVALKLNSFAFLLTSRVFVSNQNCKCKKMQNCLVNLVQAKKMLILKTTQVWMIQEAVFLPFNLYSK